MSIKRGINLNRFIPFCLDFRCIFVEKYTDEVNGTGKGRSQEII